MKIVSFFFQSIIDVCILTHFAGKTSLHQFTLFSRLCKKKTQGNVIIQI